MYKRRTYLLSRSLTASTLPFLRSNYATKLEWTKIQTQLPTKLYNHGATLIDNKIYNFQAPRLTIFVKPECHIFDPATLSWEKKKLKSGPRGVKDRVFAFKNDDEIVVFGKGAGITTKGDGTWIYDFGNNVTSKRKGSNFTAYYAAKTENPPRVWLAGDNYLGQSYKRGCQVTFYDLFHKAWRKYFKLPDNGLKGPAERKEVTISNHNHMLYSFSISRDKAKWEVHSFNTRDLHWKLLKPRGESPLPRYGCTATTMGDKIVIIGGHFSIGAAIKQHQQDVVVYNITTNSWEAVEMVGDQIPDARSSHSATPVSDNEIIVLGGRAEISYYRDAWKLTVVTP